MSASLQLGCGPWFKLRKPRSSSRQGTRRRCGPGACDAPVVRRVSCGPTMHLLLLPKAPAKAAFSVCDAPAKGVHDGGQALPLSPPTSAYRVSCGCRMARYSCCAMTAAGEADLEVIWARRPRVRNCRSLNTAPSARRRSGTPKERYTQDLRTPFPVYIVL